MQNIVGGRNSGMANKIKMNNAHVHKVNTEFWGTVGSQSLGVTALPDWGGFCPSEDKLRLLGDLSGKKVLEIGCGHGHSLKYAADLGAVELWGLDISESQLEIAESFLEKQGVSANLICSPMEEECGLPTDYFDLVYSVFGIGWSTDLDKTFKLIHSYLKKGGELVFGWSHPIHKCVSVEGGKLIFVNSYFDEEWYCGDLTNKELALSNRMLSTYINALADNGFVIEKLVEETDKEKAAASGSDYGRKALMLPTVFVIKSRAD